MAPDKGRIQAWGSGSARGDSAALRNAIDDNATTQVNRHPARIFEPISLGIVGYTARYAYRMSIVRIRAALVLAPFHPVSGGLPDGGFEARLSWV